MNNEFKPYGARINYLSKLFKSTMKEESLKQGINPTYANIVMILAKHPEGLPQNDIAEKILGNSASLLILIAFISTFI